MDRSNTNRDSDKFMVRFPEGMRERLKAAASGHNRTMNAELVHLVDAALPLPARKSHDLLAVPTDDLLAEIRRRCAS